MFKRVDPPNMFSTPVKINKGVPPPKSYGSKYDNTLDIPFDYLTSDNKVIKHRHQNEEDYFEADSDEEKANTKALKQLLNGAPIEEEDLEYIPAPGSPTLNEDSDDDGDDPLEAFMSGISKQADKDLKDIDKKTKNSAIKGLRQDIEDEDQLESYFKFMDENPLAGVAYIDDDFQLEYDIDGNAIVPEKLKIVDPLPPIDHSAIKYKPFNKDFYDETPDIVSLDANQVKELCQKLGVHVTGAMPAKPICSFAHLNLGKGIMNLLRKNEFTQPTPIQAQGMPIALSGRDVIGIAKTGSGKTLAYVLPMIIHILDQEHLKPGQGPIGLVLVPTRELCIQVYQECKKFATRSTTGSEDSDDSLNVLCVYGGGNMWEQQKALEEGCDILVATPGRLIDLIKKRAMSLEKVTFLVLDEADRMFDMGFEPQVRSLTNHTRPDRQTLLFSATFKKKIEKLARDVCTDAIKVVQGDQIGQANEDVEQDIKIFVTNDGKWNYLSTNLVKYLSSGSVLIFVTKKVNAEELVSKLSKSDFKAGLLHGDLLQPERLKVIHAFKKGEIKLLVATDVAARGLDIPHIKTVINYDIARDIDTHTHRIGRTGRAGQKGFAITFLTQRDKEFAGHLVRNLEGANQSVPEGLMELALQSSWFKKSRFGKNGKANNYKKPGIGGAGLGYKDANKSNNQSYKRSCNSTSFVNASYSTEINQSYIKHPPEAITTTKGPGTERASSIRAAFQSQYKNHFKPSTSQLVPDRNIATGPASQIKQQFSKQSFVKSSSSSSNDFNFSQTTTKSNSEDVNENHAEKRIRKSRWQ